MAGFVSAGPIDPKTKKPMGRPFKFRVKSGQVVKGWDDGISQLSLGEKARITIPAGEGLCCSLRRFGCAAGSPRRVRSGWQPVPQRLQPLLAF